MNFLLVLLNTSINFLDLSHVPSFDVFLVLYVCFSVQFSDISISAEVVHVYICVYTHTQVKLFMQNLLSKFWCFSAFEKLDLIGGHLGQGLVA